MSDTTATPETPIEQTVALHLPNAKHDLMKLLMLERGVDRKKWSEMNQDEQDRDIARMDFSAGTFLRSLVHAIAAGSLEPIPGSLESFVSKEGLKAVVHFSKDLKDSEIAALNRTTNNGRVMLVIVDPLRVLEQTHKHRAEKTQKDLPLGPDDIARENAKIEKAESAKIDAVADALAKGGHVIGDVAPHSRTMGAAESSETSEPTALSPDDPDADDINQLSTDLQEAGFWATPVQIKRWSSEKCEAARAFLELPPKKRTPAKTPDFLNMYRRD